MVLERLFEKQARYHDLIKLWNARLSVQGKEQALATRARIAACWLDNLASPGEALKATEALLTESKDPSAACGLLERIVALPASDADRLARNEELPDTVKEDPECTVDYLDHAPEDGGGTDGITTELTSDQNNGPPPSGGPHAAAPSSRDHVESRMLFETSLAYPRAWQ